MNNYVIATESTIDLSAARAAELGLSVIRMEYSIDGGELRQDEMCSDDAFAVFAKMREGSVVKTTLVTTDRFLAFWTPILESGRDILHVAFSSGLSGTWQCAMIAAAELKERFPERTILIVDSLGASGGVGLLVEYAAYWRDQGKSLAECHALLERDKLKLHLWYTVDDLVYLKRGGRISKTAAMVGSLLRIKPVMNMDVAGHLIPKYKVNGRLASIRGLAEQLCKFYDEKVFPRVIICQADAKNDAERLAEMILSHFPKADIEHSFIGTVIGAHSGPGTIALFFMGNRDRE